MGCGDPSPAAVIVDPATGVPLITTAQFDAFGNLRVSQPETIFDSKQVFDADLLNWNVPVAGGATITYQAQRASSLLSVPVGAGASAVRQTKRYFNYQPGKSDRTDVTFVLDAGDATVTKRAGRFDSNNGIFLRQVGGNLALVRRSDVSGVVVDEVVAQADWNGDPLDGSGPSGKTFNVLGVQLMRIAYEWLGAGSVQVSFAEPGKGFVLAHVFENVNILTSVFMRMPNLPVRYEIVRDSLGSAPATLEAICTSIVSEGGQQLVGNKFAADRGITARAVTAAAMLPLIAIRLRGPASTLPASATNMRRTIQILNFTIASLAQGDTSLFRLLLNPTRGAGTAPTWVAADPLSSVEFDVASTQVLTGGVEVAAGYAQGRGTEAVNSRQMAEAIGADFAGTTADEWVLAAQAQTGTNNLLAAMEWIEL